MNDFKNSENYFKKALSLRSETSPNDSFTADTMTNLGLSCLKSNALNESLAYLKKACLINEKLYISSSNKFHEKVAESYSHLGNCYLEMNDFKSKEYFESALSMNKSLDKDKKCIASSLTDLGLCLYRFKYFEESKNLLIEATEMNKSLYLTDDEKNHPKVSESYTSLALCYLELDDLTNCEAYFKNALEMNQLLFENKEDHIIASSLTYLGLAHLRFKSYNESEKYLKEALNLNQKIYSKEKNSSKISESHKYLGRCYAELKDFEQSKSNLEIALAINKSLYLKNSNENHVHVADILSDLGWLHFNFEKYFKSEALLNDAVTMYEALNKDEFSSRLASAYTRLGLNHLKLEDFVKSTSYLKKALALNEKIGKQAAADSMSHLGLCYLHFGDLENSSKLLLDACIELEEFYKNRKKSFHNSIAEAYTKIGQFYMYNGNLKKAETSFLEADKIINSLYKKDMDDCHTEIAQSANWLGKLRMENGNFTESENYFLKAKRINEKLQNHLENARSLVLLGELYFQTGNQEKCIKSYQKGIAMLLKYFKNELLELEFANAIMKLSEAYLKFGLLNESLHNSLLSLRLKQNFFNQTKNEHINLWPRTLKQKNPSFLKSEIAAAFNLIGQIYIKFGDAASAFEYLIKANDINKYLYGEIYNGNHAELANTKQNIAMAYISLGDAKSSLKYAEEALRINESINKNHSKRPLFLNTLGNACVCQGDFRRGLSYFSEANNRNQLLYGENVNHGNIIDSLENTGVLYAKYGDVKLSINMLEEARKKAESLKNQGFEYRLVSILNNLGMAYVRNGKSKEGLEKCYEALRIIQNLFGSQLTVEIKNIVQDNFPDLIDRNDTYMTLNNISLAFTRYGDAIKGILFGKKALEMIQIVHRMLPMIKELQNEQEENLKFFDRTHYSLLKSLEQNKNNPILAHISNSNDDLKKLCQLVKFKRIKLLADMGINVEKDEISKVYNLSDIASTLNNISAAFIRFVHPQKAFIYLFKALQIYNQILKRKNEARPISLDINFSSTKIQDENFTDLSVQPSIAFTLNLIGIAHVKNNNPKVGLDFNKKALDIYISVLNMGHFNDVIIPENLKSRKLQLEYKEHCKRAIDVNIESLHSFNPLIAFTIFNIGSALIFSGEFESGLNYKFQSFVMRSCLYKDGLENSDIAYSLNGIGSAYYELKDFKNCLHFYEKAYEIRKELVGEDHPDTSMSLYNIGLAFTIKKEFETSLSYFIKSKGVLEKCFTANHPDIASVLSRIGSMYNSLKKFEKALDAKNKALRMRLEIYKGINHHAIADSYNSLGITYDYMKKKDEATFHFNKALKMLEDLKGENHVGDHIDLVVSLYNTGKTYAELNKKKEAEPLLTRGDSMKSNILKETPAFKENLNRISCP